MKKLRLIGCIAFFMSNAYCMECDHGKNPLEEWPKHVKTVIETGIGHIGDSECLELDISHCFKLFTKTKCHFWKDGRIHFITIYNKDGNIHGNCETVNKKPQEFVDSLINILKQSTSKNSEVSERSLEALFALFDEAE